MDFCPIVFLGLSVAHRHVHMARGLADAVAAAFGARGETLERGTLLNVDGLDLQFVDVGTIVVFCVGNGRLQNLLDDRGFFCVKVRMFSAWSTFLPRIRSATNGLCQPTDGRPENCTCFRHGRSLIFWTFCRRWPLKVRVRANSPSLAHHLVGNVNRHVLLAVVHGNGQTDEIGQNHGATRPGLDRLLVLGGNGLLDLGYQVMVNKRTLFERAVICYPYFLRRDTIMVCVRLLLRVR